MGHYDAIVVGARAAGSPTAMLLARQGHRVLVVDRSRFPSDTLSTHIIHPPGVAALDRWGLLDAVRATETPSLGSYSFDFGPFEIAATPQPAPGGVTDAYCPRRTVLDHLLVEAAAAAGAEVREGFTVEDLVVDDGVVTGIRGHGRDGATVTEHAEVVIGADGRNSLVARAVDAPAYEERPTFAAIYYSYWSGLPLEGVKIWARPERSWGASPTTGGLTLVVLSWPRSEFEANRGDVEGNVLKTLELAPEFAEAVRGATREERFFGTGQNPGFYRKPFGPGWALVGDARHHKDPITAKGISEAFNDAEAVTSALEAVWSGESAYGDALTVYQRERDAATRAMYDFTCQLATLEPPAPEQAELLAAASADPEASRQFVSMVAGTLPVEEFMAPANVARILARAGAAPVG